MHVKYIRALCAALAVGFALTACGTRPQQAAAVPGASADPIQAQPTAAASALYPMDATCAAGANDLGANSKWMYTAARRDTGAFVATAIAYADGVQHVLCEKPGCGHIDETCEAYFFTETTDGIRPHVRVFADETQVFWVVDNMNSPDGQENPGTVQVSDPDGKNRRILSEGLVMGPPCASDGKELFFLRIRSFNNEANVITYTLSALDRQSGATRDITEISAVSLIPLGIFDGKFVFCELGAVTLPEPPKDTAAEEDWIKYHEAVQAANAKQVRTLRTLDTNGIYSEPLYTWSEEIHDQTLDAATGTVYAVRKSDNALLAISLSSGTESVVPIALPAQEGYSMEGMFGGKLVLNGFTLAPEAINDVFHRYAIDTQTGDYTELDAKQIRNGSPKPPILWSKNEDTLFFVEDTRQVERTVAGTDGTPYTYTNEEWMFATIPLEEYLSGGVNSTPATLLAPLVG